MTALDPDAWTETMTARERVRAVVELLDEPASVEEVRKQADVSWSTADRELGRMHDENMVDTVTVGGSKRYRVNPVRLLFDEIQHVINDHDRDELEAELEAMLSEEEALRAEFDATTSDELRERLARSDLSSDEVRELRNASSTWQALESGIRLYRHAPQLYEDVTQLQGGPAPTATP